MLVTEHIIIIINQMETENMAMRTHTGGMCDRLQVTCPRKEVKYEVGCRDAPVLKFTNRCLL